MEGLDCLLAVLHVVVIVTNVVSTVEGFHDAFGFSSAGRSFAARDQFLTVADLERATIAIDETPDDEFGDPVLGSRYSVRTGRDRWNVLLEGAVKLGLGGRDSLLSNDTNDYADLLQHNRGGALRGMGAARGASADVLAASRSVLDRQTER